MANRCHITLPAWQKDHTRRAILLGNRKAAALALVDELAAYMNYAGLRIGFPLPNSPLNPAKPSIAPLSRM